MDSLILRAEVGLWIIKDGANTDVSLKEKEKYVFYINQKEAKKVMKEIKEEKEEQRIIPHLKYYVGGGCLLSILLLFKSLVIGFKK